MYNLLVLLPLVFCSAVYAGDYIITIDDTIAQFAMQNTVLVNTGPGCGKLTDVKVFLQCLIDQQAKQWAVQFNNKTEQDLTVSAKDCITKGETFTVAIDKTTSAAVGSCSK